MPTDKELYQWQTKIPETLKDKMTCRRERLDKEQYPDLKENDFLDVEKMLYDMHNGTIPK